MLEKYGTRRTTQKRDTDVPSIPTKLPDGSIGVDVDTTGRGRRAKKTEGERWKKKGGRKKARSKK